ncbi:MAG: peptidase M23 [Flavobacterium sp. BFFFF1]|uniref:M23 family metallopeptidase n=1 Tax=Flavobacterium sp. BFFFF1 TaxID=2015557 RepID=UPI000BD8A0D2|nr:peptidoglycan DD-metalloendopeptidase family protein [Flavobacterium sp. BFFFF1]OYU81997.1 MAG: peptidase M23 [Flavobacterium sp. BFFFF1]
MKSLVFTLFLSAALFAQNQYPTDYFRAPLDIPLFLSGSFGELRANHFHAGLDFKTQQKEGWPVHAAADGYVVRIKISPYGYGKAIYVNHPNGFTTVYGHLSKANGAIEAYIKAAQYAQQNFEVELFPKPEELPVLKGDTIAFSGNTGGSGGPHLHFEIRDTFTEKILNPMLFGFMAKVADTRKPIITALMAYPIGTESLINQCHKPLAINVALQPDGNYIADKILVKGKVGFGIGAYDVTDSNYTKSGIFSVQAFANGNQSFGYQFDTFAFDEGRYVNALLDYSRFKNTGMRIQQLYMERPYPLSIIRSDDKNGILEAVPNLSQTYKIKVADAHSNEVNIDVPLDFSDLPAVDATPDVKKTPYYLKSGNDNNYSKDDVSVFIPADTFYDDFYLNFDVKNGKLTLQDDSVPVQKNMTITFTDTKSAEADKDKMFIASLDGKKLSYNPTTRKGNVFTSYTKNLGEFVLAKDTIAPTIKAVNFKEGKWLSKQNTLVLSIRDNLSGVKTYNGTLNGKWILFEYDYKTRSITHFFDDGIFEDGRNDLKVTVSDNVGNSAIFETHFFRKKQ